MRRTTWPNDLTVADDAPVGFVIASYNTLQLTARVIYSLYRHVQRLRFHLVVVDNASTDGSQTLLKELSEAGICEVLLNTEQRYHGPALTQGFDYLAARQATVAGGERLRYVWVLDSDCVVTRDDALSASVDVMHDNGAGIVGQWVDDEWHHGDMMGLHSLLVDPLMVWQAGIEPFQEHGSPSEALQWSAIRAGVRAVEFSFTRGGYVVHLGRGSLSQVARNADRSNKYFEWASDHNAPHFALEAEAAYRYETFLDEFRTDVGDVTASSLIRACAKYR